MYQPDLFEDKIVSLPTAKVNPNMFTEDEFRWANGAIVTIKAPIGEPLTLPTAIFLLEQAKFYLLNTYKGD